MSIRAVAAVLDGFEGSAAAKLLLVALAEYADDTGAAFPSVARLASRAGVGERAARGILARLERLDVLSISNRKGGRSLACRYRINLGPMEARAAAERLREKAERASRDSSENPEWASRDTGDKPGTVEQGFTGETLNAGAETLLGCAETLLGCAQNPVPGSRGTVIEPPKEPPKEPIAPTASRPEPPPLSLIPTTPPPTPPVVELILNDGTTYGVTVEQAAKWTIAFPAVPIVPVLRRMAAWCEANKARRKTRRGIENAIFGWLSREQDKAPKVATNERTGFKVAL